MKAIVYTKYGTPDVLELKEIDRPVPKDDEVLANMNELFETGKIKPVIDGPYSLEEVPKVFRLFTEGLHKGKVVIKVNHEIK